MHTAGDKTKFCCSFSLPSPAKPAQMLQFCQQVPIPCKASGREGWEGTSKDRLRQRYNRRDGTVVGTFSWDGGGFFSPRAPPQSSPWFYDSETSALPARAKESSGVTGSVEALQMGGHTKGRRVKLTHPNVCSGAEG